MKTKNSIKYYLQAAPKLWYIVVVAVFLILILVLMGVWSFVFVSSTVSFSKMIVLKSIEDFVEDIREVYISNSNFIVNLTYEALRIYKAGYDVSSFLSKRTNEAFPQINYYIIDQRGVIVESDYSNDIGLDLSVYESFWEELKEVGREVKVQEFGFEVIGTRLRIFSYVREGEGWFELGFLISDRFFERLRSEILKITNSYFVRDVCLYTGNMDPVLGGCNAQQGLFSYRTLTEVEVRALDGYKEKFFFQIDFCFSKVFYFLMLLFALVVIGFVSLAYVFRSFSSLVEKDISNLRVLALESYERVVFNKKFREHQFKIDELQDVAEVLVKSSINAISYLNELKFAKARIEIMNIELKNAYTGFLNKIATIIESFDLQTSLHMYRVFFVTKFILEELGIKDSNIPMFSTFHDIGKIFVRREILTKKGPLTPEEWEEMKQHTVKARLLIDHPILEEALNICVYHHENFDGSGYPEGLKGEKIPFEARVVKIADVYDALRDERPYKEPFSHEMAITIMTRGDNRTSPKHFDPELFKIFMKIEEKVKILYETKNFDNVFK